MPFDILAQIASPIQGTDTWMHRHLELAWIPYDKAWLEAASQKASCDLVIQTLWTSFIHLVVGLSYRCALMVCGNRFVVTGS
jgi:hypothetical protein